MVATSRWDDTVDTDPLGGNKAPDVGRQHSSPLIGHVLCSLYDRDSSAQYRSVKPCPHSRTIVAEFGDYSP